MKIKKEEKLYNSNDIAKKIKKTVYKSIVKALKDPKYGKVAQDIIHDIFDHNDVAEVNPDDIPEQKEAVMAKKSKKPKTSKKLKKFLEKRQCKKGEAVPGLMEAGNPHMVS